MTRPKTSSTKPKATKSQPKAAAKPAARTAAKPAAAKPTAATSPAIDVATLDASNDQKNPDAAVSVLVKHAQSLSGVVRSLLAQLSNAKVTASDATRLDALATLLDSRESAWQDARKATSTGTVAKRRKVLLEGRTLLYGALDSFVEGESIEQALREIGGVDDDDDLESDAARLVALARAHTTDLEGTEVTPAAVDAVESALAEFRKARKGAVDTEGDDETTKQTLSESARVALEARNRVYWTLAALDRRVVKRGQFRFRNDEKRRALFTAYTTNTSRPKKSVASAPVNPGNGATPAQP